MDAQPPLSESRFGDDYLTTVEDSDGKTVWVLVSFELGHPKLTFYKTLPSNTVEQYDPKRMDFAHMYQGSILDD